MKLIRMQIEYEVREKRESDFYNIDGTLIQGAQYISPYISPNGVAIVEIYGQTITAFFQKSPDEPMPDAVRIPDGRELQCIGCDDDGVVTATRFFASSV